MRKIENKYLIENSIEAFLFAEDIIECPESYNWACDEQSKNGYIFCCGQCL